MKFFQLCKIFLFTDLCIDQVLVPPDGEGHHGVAVGHDQHRDDVLRGEDEAVVH